MVESTYVVTDLGGGDGGKGGVVHKIATMKRSHTIIKRGGGQGQHGVENSQGESFAFSNWGCGTLEGIRTHISDLFIIPVVGLLNEAQALQYLAGIHNAYDLLTVDERVLCATVYHGFASRFKEMARRDNPRGTIGTGVGEAYRYSEKYPELTIRAADLARPGIRERLSAIRNQVIKDLSEIIQGDFLPSDREEVQSEKSLLFDDNFFEFAVERLQQAGRMMKVVEADYFRREILSKPGNIVIESSHGVLTDHFHGFHPHVSAIRTLPCFTHEMLREAGYDGKIVNIGVHRAYEIKHGAGPLPTEEPAMLQDLLPGSHKVKNRYRGQVRVGPLDFNLMRYAIEVCGGPTAFDGLAITWFDQIQKKGVWHFCDRYKNSNDQNFFTPTGAIRVRRGSDEAQRAYQEQLGQQLFRCKPEITKLTPPANASREELYALCADTLKEKVGVPVRMVAFGPTELDKLCK